MPRNLFNDQIDVSQVDDLISGTLIPAKVINGTLNPTGDGIVKRGTLLTTADGVTYDVWEPGAGTDPNPDIDAILLLDIDSDDADEAIGAPIAYQGEFNQNKIEEVMELTLDALTIHKARKQVMFIAPMQRAPEAF
jgi:hypothetical protein